MDLCFPWCEQNYTRGRGETLFLYLPGRPCQCTFSLTTLSPSSSDWIVRAYFSHCHKLPSQSFQESSPGPSLTERKFQIAVFVILVASRLFGPIYPRFFFYNYKKSMHTIQFMKAVCVTWSKYTVADCTASKYIYWTELPLAFLQWAMLYWLGTRRVSSCIAIPYPGHSTKAISFSAQYYGGKESTTMSTFVEWMKAYR